MSFVRNAAGVLLTSAVSVPLGVLSSILLARYLLVEERGLYGVAFAFAGVAAAASRMGWPSAAIYRIRRCGSDPAVVLGAGLSAVGTISLVVAGLAVLLEPFLTRQFMDDAPARIFFLVLATVPFQLLTYLLSAISRGIDHFRLQNWATFAFTSGTLVVLTLVLVLADGDLTELLAALLAVRITVSLGLALAVWRHTGVSFRFGVGEIRESLRFGLRSHSHGLAGILHENVDVLMIAHLVADPAQVAYYAVAVGVIQRVKLAPGALAAATFPKVAGLAPGEARRFVCAVSRQSIALVALTVVLLGAAAPWLIPLLYGAPYAASIAPFAILLPGMALLTIYQVVGRYFTGLNRQRVNIISQVVSLSANVALNLFLIPRFGIVGAALASLLSYGLEATIISIAFARTTGCGYRELLIFQRGDLDAYRDRLAPRWQRLSRRRQASPRD